MDSERRKRFAPLFPGTGPAPRRRIHINFIFICLLLAVALGIGEELKPGLIESNAGRLGRRWQAVLDAFAGRLPARDELQQPPPSHDKLTQFLPIDVDAYLRWNNLLLSIAYENRLDPDLLRALISVESGFRTDLVTAQGKGLMQLSEEIVKQFEVTDPLAAGENMDAGARYLRQLLDKFGGDVSRALSAYHFGPEMALHNGTPAFKKEADEYVEKVLTAHRLLQGQ